MRTAVDQTLARLSARAWLIPLAIAVILLVLPVIGIDRSTARNLELAAIFTLLISGLNLTFGYTGEFAFSQVFTYMAGGYFAGYMGSAHGNSELLVILPGTVVLAAIVAIITGVPGLRLGSLSLAMVSFFLVLLVPDVVVIGKDYLGGFEGLSGIPAPTVAGVQLDDTGMYLAIVAITIVWIVVMRNLVTSRHGVALQIVRTSPILAASLGIPTSRLKLVAYFLGGVPAGIAGALFAYLNTFVHPALFNLTIALTMLAGSIIGGSVSIYGSLVGAFLVGILPVRLLAIQSYSDIIFGILLVVAAIFFADGAAGTARRLMHSIVRPPERPPTTVERKEYRAQGQELVVTGVSRSFGGVKALDNVSVTASKGKITAIVGPNGSGKTTLLNLISGLVKADSGSITVDGRAMSELPPYRVAQLGVSRTFQTPIVPAAMPVIDVVSSARYERPYTDMFSTVLRLPGFRRVRAQDDHLSLVALTLVGAAKHADAAASELALGTRRLVEMARALVSAPAVMLLDEPASGLEAEELSAFADLLRELRLAGATIVLVEHNFPFVLSLADTIHVMDQGKVIRSGAPDVIANDPTVIEVYVGAKHEYKQPQGQEQREAL